MVRKSVLVYDLLRTEQPQEGFSEREIFEHISNKHDIAPGKGLRRQIAVALRRGLDFGILAKKNNKFRFDPDYKARTTRRNVPKKKTERKKKKTGKGTKTRKQGSTSRSKDRKRTRSVPRPKVPPPPSWTPKRRNLNEEPLTKVKKHEK